MYEVFRCKFEEIIPCIKKTGTVRMLLLIAWESLKNPLHLIRYALLQRGPAILPAPFLQQSKRLIGISCNAKFRLVHKVVSELPLRIHLSQNSEHIIHVAVPAPGLQACTIAVRIQHCCNMKKRRIFDVDVDDYEKLRSIVSDKG